MILSVLFGGRCEGLKSLANVFIVWHILEFGGARAGCADSLRRRVEGL